MNFNPIEIMICFPVDWPARALSRRRVWRSAGTAAGTNDNACCEQSNDREKIAVYFRSNSSVHALFPRAPTFQINQICSGMCEAAGTSRGRKQTRAKSPRRSFRTELSPPRSFEPGNVIMSHVINSPLRITFSFSSFPFPPLPSRLS